MLDDESARVTVAGDDVEGARREELGGDLGEQEGGLRRGVTRLEDDRVARSQSGGDLPDRHHEGVVPGRHLTDDTDRLAADPRGVALHVLAGRAPLEDPGGPGEEADLIDRGRDLLARGEGMRLAGVLSLEAHEVISALLDGVGQFEQGLLALAGGRAAPFGKGGVSGGIRRIDVFGHAHGRGGDDRARGRVDDVLSFLPTGLDELAVDEVAQGARCAHVKASP